jgi:DNA replication protein
MRVFSGFAPGKAKLLRIAEPFFTELVPLIDSLSELKVTLHVFYLLGRQSGDPRFVRASDLERDPILQRSLEGSGEPGLQTALERAVDRGTLLRAVREESGESDTVYFANTPGGRAAVDAIRQGKWPSQGEPAEQATIFSLYEQNIGPLTPLIADQLQEAEQTYPQAWLEDAFREAVAANKRSWRYIRAILRRWQDEGRDDKSLLNDSKADRRRYVTGKYSEFIKH